MLGVLAEAAKDILEDKDTVTRGGKIRVADLTVHQLTHPELTLRGHGVPDSGAYSKACEHDEPEKHESDRVGMFSQTLHDIPVKQIIGNYFLGINFLLSVVYPERKIKNTAYNRQYKYQQQVSKCFCRIMCINDDPVCRDDIKHQHYDGNDIRIIFQQQEIH